MATPAVAGAVALLLQEQSTLTPDQVKARLMKTAYKMGFTSTSAWVPHLMHVVPQLLRSVLGRIGIDERAGRHDQY